MRLFTVAFGYRRTNRADIHMTNCRAMVLILVATALTACGMATLRSDRQRIAIADEAWLVLPRPGDLTESFDAVQVINAEYEDRSYSFEAHVRARPGEISIVALGALGGPLFSIGYDGMELVAEGSQEAQLVSAEYVLADVLLTHWDVDWLNGRLEGAAIELSQDGMERFVTRDGQLVVGIAFDSTDPWGGTATLTHLERGYVLEIRTARFNRP